MSFIGNKPTLRSGLTGGIWTPNKAITQRQNSIWEPSDPLFGKVLLLVQHTSAERGFSDKSLYRRAPVYNNMTSTYPSQLVPINTAYAPAWAGMRSLYFANGGSHHIDIPDSNDWTPNGDFTIDVVYWTSGAGGDGVLFQQGGYNSDQPSWAVVSRPDGHAYGRVASSSTTAILGYSNSDTAAPLNNAHHLVIQRSGNTYSFGIDGNFTTQLTSASNPWNPDKVVTIGADNTQAGLFLGEIYAIRMTSAARYTGSTFTNAVTNGPFPTR